MKRLLARTLLAAVLALSSSTVLAQQADPRDYELGYFAPNNSVAINVYARHEGATKPRDYTATTGIFRATHLIKKGEWVFVPFDVLLPVTNLTVNTTLDNPVRTLVSHASGLGDLLWIPTMGTGLLQNATNHTHTWFALTPYVTFPTGNYSTKNAVNTGGNRFIFRPQVVLGQRFARAFTVEAFANVAIYGKNDEYRVSPLAIGAISAQAAALAPIVAGTLGGNREMKQDPSVGAALLTAMDLSPTFMLTASYYYSMNGRQDLDIEVPDGLPPQLAQVLQSYDTPQYKQKIHTLRFGMGIRVEKQTLLLFQLNQDVASENASISRGFFVRVTHLFFPPPKPQSRPQIEAPAGQGQPPPPPEARPEPPQPPKS